MSHDWEQSVSISVGQGLTSNFHSKLVQLEKHLSVSGHVEMATVDIIVPRETTGPDSSDHRSFRNRGSKRKPRGSAPSELCMQRRHWSCKTWLFTYEHTTREKINSPPTVRNFLSDWTSLYVYSDWSKYRCSYPIQFEPAVPCFESRMLLAIAKLRWSVFHSNLMPKT